MTTDKERAEVYRELADELPTDAYWDRSGLTHKADQLDPPKPEWPDGTVAWVTNSHQRTYLCQWCETEDNWCIGGPDGDSAPGSVTKVEPLRVLGADELDPPAPKWPNYTVAYVTLATGNKMLARYDSVDDAWESGWSRYGSADTVTFGHEVTKVEPLRVLGDDEIAVKRFEVDYMGPCDTTAKFMREAADRATKLDHGSNVTRAVRKVLRGYADALDAEAGGQS